MLLTNSLFIHLIQDPCKADIVGKDLQWPRFVPNNVKEKYTIHQTIKFQSCLMSSLHTSLSWCAEIPMKCIDSAWDCSAFKDCLNLVYKRTISIKQRKSYSFAFHKNLFFAIFPTLEILCCRGNRLSISDGAPFPRFCHTGWLDHDGPTGILVIWKGKALLTAQARLDWAPYRLYWPHSDLPE